MKWKRSKKAQQEAKSGRESGSSGSSSSKQDSRPSATVSPNSGDDDKSVKVDKRYANSTVQPQQLPHQLPTAMSSHPPSSVRMYTGTGNGLEVDYSSTMAVNSKYESSSGGGSNVSPSSGGTGPVAAQTLMKRTPLFFPDEVNGDMFRPYVS